MIPHGHTLLIAYWLVSGPIYAQQPVTAVESLGGPVSAIGGSTANLVMTETDQPANSRRWIWFLDGGVLNAQITNDDGSSPVTWMRVTRFGNAITSVEFPKISLTGPVQQQSGGYFNWGAVTGSAGYGIRDNNGTLEYKNRGGAWQSFANSSQSRWVDHGNTLQTLTNTDRVLIGNLNDIRYASMHDGSDAGQRFAHAMAELSSSGGIVVGTGLDGPQTWSRDPFAGITKPIMLELGVGTTRLSEDVVVPATSTIRFNTGSIMSVDCRKTLTINGSIIAPITKVFDGCGSIQIGRNKPTRVPEVYPQWWGAKGDGGRVHDAAMTSGTVTLTSATASFTSDDVGKLIVVEGAGSAGATLITTIVSITSSTTAVLANKALTSVSNVQAIWATDDTAAIQGALDSHHRVRLIPGIYGITSIRLHYRSQFVGSGIDNTALSRMAVGSGGAALSMVTGEPPQDISITDLTVYANQIGSEVGGLDGINIGNEGPDLRYANGSWMNNVRVVSTSGVGLNIGSNIGYVGQIWVQNLEQGGTPRTLRIPNSVGIKIIDTDFTAGLLSVEGHFEAGEMVLNAGGSNYSHLQIQPSGHYQGADMITLGASFQSIGSVFAAQIRGPATRRNFLRIAKGVQAIRIAGNLVNPTAYPISVTNMLTDESNGVTLPYDAFHGTVSSYANDQRNTVVYDDTYKISFGKRIATRRGSDVNAATNVTLPYNGNVFRVVGNSTIDTITTTDWPDGAEITLIFTGNPWIRHNNGGGTGTAPIYFMSQRNVQAASDLVLTLVYNAVASRWQQKSSSTPQPYSVLETLDFGVINAHEQADVSVRVPGAREGDSVKVTAPGAVMRQSVMVDGWVSNDNTVMVRLSNYGLLATPNIEPGNFRIDVWPR